MNSGYLPYGRQCIDDDDVAAVTAVLRGDFLTTGPSVDAFEIALAESVGASYAVVCSSGTSALHIAMAALKLGENDVVGMPSVTFLATANAARYVGAEVEFVDVEATTGLATPALFEQIYKGTRRGTLKALAPVHLAGQCVDMPTLAKSAGRLGLRIIEDAAHAIGTSYVDENGESVPVGSCRHSDMTVFSFHPVKTITMGEGGAVTTNDPALYHSLLRLRSHGMVRQAKDFTNHDLAFAQGGESNPWYYEMSELGFNYRSSDLHCALGLSQLEKLPRFRERRRTLVAQYDQELAALSPTVKPISRVSHCTPTWHLYPVLIDFRGLGLERALVMEKLRSQRIGTQVHYIPVHLQPYYRKRYGTHSLPGATDYYEKTLSLPLFVDMTKADVSHVVRTLGEVLASR
jgi:UDP-4-amino-4,6-dideoxy-N-acetyl-beta-L-altrosamine transaminase